MKRFLLEHLGLKLTALVLAFGLWVYVGTSQVLERRVDLKVVFMDVPVDAALSPSVKGSVPVVLVGRKEKVIPLESSDLRAVVSLKGVPVPSTDFPVRLQVDKLPKGVALDAPPFLVSLAKAGPQPTPARSFFRRRK